MSDKVEGIVYDLTTLAMKIEGAYSNLNSMFQNVGKIYMTVYGNCVHNIIVIYMI